MYPSNETLNLTLFQGVSSETNNRSLLFAALLAADLIVPHETQCVRETNGARELLVFTDLAAYGRYFKDTSHNLRVLSSRQLCHSALSENLDAVILNVGGPVGYKMPRWEVEAVAQGHVPQDQPASSIQIGRYDALPIPKATIAALAKAVAIPEVAEVYWHWIRTGESKPQICLSISPASSETVLALQTSIRQAIPESIRQQNPIILRGLDEDPEIAALIREHGQQLYPPQGSD